MEAAPSRPLNLRLCWRPADPRPRLLLLPQPPPFLRLSANHPVIQRVDNSIICLSGLAWSVSPRQRRSLEGLLLRSDWPFVHWPSGLVYMDVCCWLLAKPTPLFW